MRAGDDGGARSFRDRYRMLDHTADLGFEVFGATLGKLLENAAGAMFEQMADLGAVRPRTRMSIGIEADSTEELLHDWLSELLYLFETGSRLFSRFEVEPVSGTRIQASVWGEKIDRRRHGLKSPVKAVTRHMLEVRHTESGWSATVVCDV